MSEAAVSPPARAPLAAHLSRSERYAPYLAAGLLSAPTLLAHYLPMSDLPLHEGVVGVLQHYGDERYFPRDLYVLNLGHSNQLFHLLAWPIACLVGSIWASKIVIAATQVLLFVGGARLADHLGRSRWSTLLLAPLALGFTYYWGLIPNLTGLTAFMFALPILDRGAVTPTLRRALLSCAVLLILFYAHYSTFVVGAGFAAMLAIAHPFERRETVLRGVPVAFAPAFLVAYHFWSLKFFTGAQLRPPMRFSPLLEKLTSVPNVLFGSHDLPMRLALFALAVGALASFTVARRREGRATTAGSASVPESGLRRLRSLLLGYRYEATAVGFLTAYLAMPSWWNGTTMVYERFLGPAWSLAVICAAPRGDPPRIAKLLAAVVPIGILLLAWPQFVDAHRTFTDLDAMIAKIPKNRSTTLVSLDRGVFRTRVYSASAGPARAIADRGGRIGISLMFTPRSAVQVRPEYRWDEYELRTILNGSRALYPSHDLKRFEYVIAESREPEVRALLVRALVPDAELVAAQGEWMLFRSTWEQAPLTSAEPRPPKGIETVLDRVRFLAVMDAKGQDLGNEP